MREANANINNNIDNDNFSVVDGNFILNRPVIKQKDLYSHYKDVDLESADFKIASDCFGIPTAVKTFKCTPLKWLFSILPIFEWFPKYQWKEDLKNDIIAGLTVSFMHIPQGMGFALLAYINPVIGIYMSFFPIIVYTFMGTSKHGSLGAFTVIGLMTGSIVSNQLDKYDDSSREPETSTDATEDDSIVPASYKYSPEQIVATITLTVGLCQVLMGSLRLGRISLLLSPALVGGFTTGSAIHVLTSQLKTLLGLGIKERQGIFKIPLGYYDIASNIKDSNTAAIIMAAVTMLSLIIYNELLKETLSKKIPFPIPVEMLAIVIGTIVSHFGNMHSKYDVPIVGDIPTGMPTPALPPLDIIPDVVVGSFVISIVAYAVSISMAKLFAEKHHYYVDPNQELLAMGSSNVVGGVFKCAPVSISLARSMVQEAVGGRSQLTGVFSCCVLLLVLLWIGPYFEDLPHCVLASIIIVALKKLLFQALDLPRIWNECSIHGLIWTASFLGTVVLDNEYGLGIGVVISLLTLVWRSNKSEMSILGQYENYDLYVDTNICTDAKEIPGIKIIKYSGSLNFATVEYFLASFNNIMADIIFNQETDDIKKNMGGKIINSLSNGIEEQPEKRSELRWIILDLSSTSSIDPEAIKSLRELRKNYTNKGISFVYANCSVNVFHGMIKCGFVQNAGTNSFFPTLYDAIIFCKSHTKVSSHNYL